jgi:hypothetical protein
MVISTLEKSASSGGDFRIGLRILSRGYAADVSARCRACGLPVSRVSDSYRLFRVTCGVGIAEASEKRRARVTEK